MSQQRLYRGQSAQERVQERRVRLLQSALELFGTQGYAATTIEQLCAAAKVSTRAFYECFDSREELLIALHDQIFGGALAATKRARSAAGRYVPNRVRAALWAYICYLTEDIRRVQVVHAEILALPDPLSRQRWEARQDLIGLISEDFIPDAGDRAIDPRHLAVGLIGACSELLAEWVRSPNRPAPEKLLATAEYLFVATLDRAARSPEDSIDRLTLPGIDDDRRAASSN